MTPAHDDPAALRLRYVQARPPGGWWTEVTWEQPGWMDGAWLEVASAYATELFSLVV